MLLVASQKHKGSYGLIRGSSAYLFSSSNTLTKFACALMTCEARKGQIDTVARKYSIATRTHQQRTFP